MDIKALDDTWYIARLHYDSADIQITLTFEAGVIHLALNNSKANIEDDFNSSAEVLEYLTQMLGSYRAQEIMCHWQEITYRKKGTEISQRMND